MISKKLKIILTGSAIFICLLLLFIIPIIKKPTYDYSYTTKPLYVHDELYISDHPLIYIKDVLFFPLEIFSSDTTQYSTNSSKDVIEIDKTIYLSQNYIENVLNKQISDNEDSVYISYNFDYSWADNNTYIAHSLGEIDDNIGTNSLEAFNTSYEKGIRIFEVDLSITSDNKLVAIGDWEQALETLNISNQDTPLSQEEFLSSKILGKYTTLSFEDILKLMQKYPDIYIVTNTQQTTEPYISLQFEHIVNTAEKIDVNLLDRIIPQIYNNDMFHSIMDIHEWKSIIYSIYNLENNFSREEVLDFLIRNGINVITTNIKHSPKAFVDKLIENDKLVYLHSLNDFENVELWESRGIHGFYTDFLY